MKHGFKGFDQYTPHEVTVRGNALGGSDVTVNGVRLPGVMQCIITHEVGVVTTQLTIRSYDAILEVKEPKAKPKARRTRAKPRRK